MKILATIFVIVSMMCSMENISISKSDIGPAICKCTFDTATEESMTEIISVVKDYDLIIVSFEGDYAELWFSNGLAEFIMEIPTNKEPDESWTKVAEKALENEEDIIFTIWTNGETYSVTAVG